MQHDFIRAISEFGTKCFDGVSVMDSLDILDIVDAAKYLQMHPTTLQKKAKAGIIPGRKAGKKWVFLRKYLAEWLKGDINYQEMEATTCQSTSGVKPGGLASQPQTESQYAKVLKLPSNARLKSTTTG